MQVKKQSGKELKEIHGTKKLALPKQGEFSKSG